MRFKDIKFLFSPTPPYVIYHVTNRCNLNCAHCFAYREKEKKIEELSLEEVQKITKHLAHVKYLTLAGGEPLLRDDLADIVRAFYKINDLHIANIVTNGWFMEKTIDIVDSILKSCPDLVVSVGVSVDGPEAIHDSIRCAPGSYKRAVSTINALQALSAKHHQNRLFVIGCGTYNAANSDEIVPTAKFFSKELGTAYYVGLIRGQVRDKRLKHIDIDHFKSTSLEINRINKNRLADAYPFRRLRLALDDLMTEIICSSVKDNKCTVKCQAGKKGMVLKADGDIPLCEMLDINLGNVRACSYDPKTILTSSNTRRIIKETVKSRCHCTWECFQRMNVIFSPQMYLRFKNRV